MASFRMAQLRPVAVRYSRHFTSASSLQQQSLKETLSWEEFLRLRKQRRIFGIGSSVPTAIIGTLGGVSFFASHDIDPSQQLFGLDPFMVYGLATVGCGVVGWLLGPPLGYGTWRLWNRSKMAGFDTRQTEFFNHIKRNRVDPSFQSFNNPVPDYYGEKIGSLKVGTCGSIY